MDDAGGRLTDVIEPGGEKDTYKVFDLGRDALALQTFDIMVSKFASPLSWVSKFAQRRDIRRSHSQERILAKRLLNTTESQLPCQIDHRRE